MNEEKATQEKPEEPVEEQDAGDKSKTDSMLERASAENERMEANLKKKEELVEREEALEARKILGGTAEAGQQTPEAKEETSKEYADRIMKNEGK